MAERKVLNKYFPKNFDHEKIEKRGRGKDKLMIVRNMLPMSLRCNKCSNYLYIGTKFNMRMEICNDEVYLGIKVFRFYLKCTYCYADITFKTDPKNHDYVVETGGVRNYEPIKDAQQAEKLLKKMKVNEKEGDSMKYLENKTYDSKRQMELTETLEEIKNLNKRQGVIDPEDLLKNIIYMQEQQQNITEEQQRQMQRQYEQLKRKREEYKRMESETKVLKQSIHNAIKEESENQEREANQPEINKDKSHIKKQIKPPNNGFDGQKSLVKKILNYKKKIIKKQ